MGYPACANSPGNRTISARSGEFMPFIGDVVVRELPAGEGSRWQLVEPLGYQGREQMFTVEAGFTTDFASVPQALTWLVPRYGRYTKAAILHDFLWSQCRVGR